jgi:bifunctional UDP-N-acetylglucosamine pyrophosphorylase/glucosamine-1-phosphate N-acetyltransferase
MVAVAILAAGRGTRMKSSLPKVLHSVGGISMVERVLQGLESLQPEHIFIIVGFGQEKVREALAHRSGLRFVEQTEQLGTGHAVQQVIPHLQGFEGDLLVLNGDVPLLRQSTLENLVSTHQQKDNAATLLTAQFPDPTGYGRVFCNDQNIITENC